MPEYRKVELQGKVYLLTFVDFLPVKLESSRQAVEAVARLEKQDLEELPAAQSILSNGEVSAIYANGTIYITDKFKDKQDEVASICEKIENSILSGGTYYQPEQLVQGFNSSVGKDGADIHAHVLREGFAIKANVYDRGATVSFTTIGLHHQGLPEFIVVGGFGDSVNMVMGIIHGVTQYMQDNGVSVGEFPAGTIFEKGRIKIQKVDQTAHGMSELLEPIKDYWQDVDFELAQILISDYEMRVPNESGYSQKTNYQPLLPRLEELINA